MIPGECRKTEVDLASYENDKLCSLVNLFAHFLPNREKKGIIQQWLILRARLAKQRTLKTIDAFSNRLLSPQEDVKDCLMMIDLLVTLSPSTAKCERRFSTMNQSKNLARAQTNQDTLTTLMRVRSSDCNLGNFYLAPTIEHWMNEVKTKRHVKL